MKNKPCPFCDYQKLTEIFYYDRWKNIIICRDLRPLGFKYRLLAVRTGIQNHKSLPTGVERDELLTPLLAVATAQVREGMAGGYEIDEVAKEIPGHYHYQCNMT